MIYITQLIFVKPGKEETFLEFERFALPLMQQHNGRLLYRIRPDEANFVDKHQDETPYEIHFMSFDSEHDLQSFLKNDERLTFIHLKEESVKSIWLVKGERMA